MRKFIITALLTLSSQAAFSAQWLELNPSNIANINIIQANNSHGSPEGLYIGLKANIVGEASSYCTNKNVVIISDPKLIDRAYSGLLFAISTQKNFQLYVDGAGKCLANSPIVTMFMLKP
ncbi:MAG TPA: hypothetical protein VL995_17470 [Cellvibrio sp.]|nr:hypothetical protein [Cellvibrio sp.]